MTGLPLLCSVLVAVVALVAIVGRVVWIERNDRWWRQ